MPDFTHCFKPQPEHFAIDGTMINSTIHWEDPKDKTLNLKIRRDIKRKLPIDAQTTCTKTQSRQENAPDG